MSVNSLRLVRCDRRAFTTLKIQLRSLFASSKTCNPKNFKDYESIKQEYKSQVPEYFNFANDVLDNWSRMEKVGSRGSNPAFWWLSEHGQQVKWSFQDLEVHSKKVANILSDACDLQLKDRVLVILPRVPEWWLVNIACIRTGTVLIPGTTQLTATDILHRLQASKAKCIITDDSLVDAVESVASNCPSLKAKLVVSQKHKQGWMNFQDLFRNASDDHKCVNTKSLDPMAIFFTSGSTGAPKMALHTHCSYGIGHTVNGRYWLDLTASDVVWCSSDTGWVKSAWNSFFSPWIQGACTFVHQMPRFDPKTMLEVLLCATFKGMKIKLGSMGKPAPEINVQIIDENHNVVPPGVEGQIAVQMKPIRPFGLFSGYIGDPQQTAAVLQDDYYLTGDRGRMDEDGYVWFHGRTDDIILSAGYRIGPFEVENALTTHPAVADCAVVGSPDPIRGEVVKAFVVQNAAYTLADPDKLIKELQDHVKKVTAPYKYPRKIEFVDSLPKTISGKVKRNLLREKERGQS
ncbi:hypothetical protein chiPu_0015207 [Chiloscyllium punctatum]|uniref:medium-chain acyl-CoA ligase n=1 Tax=Chiloscyllium punctatum TaxID=137246 RepID=A0A401T224_CHIPU|nr:hypothetical protein [Chiloscyllium punctatum]